MRYWILKSEPTCFSIDDLQNAPDQIAHWDGVRNYQARNYIRDDMQIGDLAFFYHSNCKVPGIIGLIRIITAAYPDHTAFDPNSAHPDLTSSPNNPRWFMVDVQFIKKLDNIIPLVVLKRQWALKNLSLIQKGNRLSVMPVEAPEWNYLASMAKV